MVAVIFMHDPCVHQLLPQTLKLRLQVNHDPYFINSIKNTHNHTSKTKYLQTVVYVGIFFPSKQHTSSHISMYLITNKHNQTCKSSQTITNEQTLI